MSNLLRKSTGVLERLIWYEDMSWFLGKIWLYKFESKEEAKASKGVSETILNAFDPIVIAKATMYPA